MARDQLEPGIAGWVIELAGATGSCTTTTAADGSFSFGALLAGAYILCEGEGPWLAGGYVQTAPADSAGRNLKVEATMSGVSVMWISATALSRRSSA